MADSSQKQWTQEDSGAAKQITQQHKMYYSLKLTFKNEKNVDFFQTYKNQNRSYYHQTYTTWNVKWSSLDRRKMIPDGHITLHKRTNSRENEGDYYWYWT